MGSTGKNAGGNMKKIRAAIVSSTGTDKHAIGAAMSCGHGQSSAIVAGQERSSQGTVGR
jgi:hypothetical protein